ncbi:MAG TPA: 4Fe-4S binding protein [Rhodoblastus sp.]|nr:4Fe-4S binding protein [Rhodoblastus sp.]
MSAIRALRMGVMALCAVASLLSCVAHAAPADLRAYAREKFGPGVELRDHKTDEGAVVEAWRDGVYAGLAFSTWDLIRSVGYSGQPIDIWATLDPALVVGAARLVRQTEPLLVIGLRPEQLEELVAGQSGLDIRSLKRVAAIDGKPGVDHISGATISSNVLRDSVIRAARKAARISGRLGEGSKLLRDRFEMSDWRALVAAGAIAERKINASDMAIAGAGGEARDQPLLDVFVALATPAGIGVNLIGRKHYEQIVSTAGPEDDLVMVGANGLLSIKGGKWRETGVFERLAIVQDARTIRLTGDMHRAFDKIEAEYAPELRERAIFVVPHATGFDATKPWRLQVLAVRRTAEGGESAQTFEIPYAVPTDYVARPPPEAAAAGEEALWERAWRERRYEIGALLVMLGALVLILLFQDQLVARPKLYRATRIVFMAATLGFIGVFARAQLSVVHVVTFAHALRTNFQWSFFLLDPLIFLLWGFVAVAMLFWGRGVFCGWLCPFGALQELLNEAARRLRIPQVEAPWGLHERLWIVKYLVFLAIFALSLNDMKMAFVAAEAEPFKTVVALHFAREWPFVAFAVALLAAGLFVRRFYCRYLCPLGAALAIPARMRMFDWLKRRPQCGRECRQCAVHCPVGAIYPSGAISPNECIYCLNCQSLYHDPHVCLGLKARAARQAARAQISGGAANG